MSRPPRPQDTHCWRCGRLAPLPPTPCPRCGNTAEIPAERPHRGLAGAYVGVTSPLRGLWFLNAHPKLWSWIVLPLVVNAALFVTVVWLLWSTRGAWVPDLAEPWPAWIDWLRTGLGWVLEALVVVVSVLAALLTSLILAGVVNAPFYDALSAAVENRVLGKDPGRPWSAFFADVARSLRAAVSLALRQLLVLLLLFPLTFTAVGAVLWAFAGFYYAGLAQFDVVMARNVSRGSRRAAWGRRHVFLVAASGVPVSVVPLVAPFGIVGATLAFLDDPDKP